MAPITSIKTEKSKEIVKNKLRERKKASKQALKEKRARLIVRNLPFKATEENLKEYFEQYGEVANVDLLKKPDGKLVGCCFVQFKFVQKAAKARYHANEKEFLGRKISVDFAKAQDKYKEEIKKEEETVIKKEPKVEEEEEENNSKVEITDEDYEKSLSVEIKEDSDSDISCESDEKKDISDTPVERDVGVRKPHVISNDVTEGRTVFVKNVPFDVTNEDLRNCMLQFGPVFYALICMDKFTEHSKGTAFVKFVNKEDAEKALQAGTELTLLGNILDCHPALGRNDVNKKAQDKKESKKNPKDSRNLYLVKEGVILAGSKSAEGVSATDMAKRLQIEQYKTQMLRNLNMFVSRDRLVCHNLPASWDDGKLRQLFEKYGGKDSYVKEARIMRDLKNVDANGLGKSKEYGFVAFSKHENALQALRTLNNNPNIFSATKRPIITFSIENKSAINARLKRLEKSKIRNVGNTKSNKETQGKKFGKKHGNKVLKDEGGSADNIARFTGLASEPGKVQKMRSRYKLANQAKLHHETLKLEKRKKKNAKQTLAEKKKQFTKQPKQKINKEKKENDNFSKLVNEYKKKLVNTVAVKKSKWYE